MGRRGTKPKPTALKLLMGVEAGRVNLDEPTPPKGVGAPPDHLDALGLEAWRRLTLALDSMGILTAVDGEAVAMYCVAYSTWRRATKAAGDELTIRTTTTVKVNPLIQVANEAQRQMARLLVEFGMTPSSRTSLHVPGRPEDDPILAFLNRKPKR